MKVQLTAHWRDHLPGDVVDVPFGRELIYDGVAREVETAARERAPKPHKAAAVTPDEPGDDDAGAVTP